jgi:hypothetical protein
MKSTPCLAGALCLAAQLAAGPAAATVDVAFIDPAHFSDIDNHGPWGSLRPAEVLDVIGRQLRLLGARCVPADQTLELRVTDLRLAGELAAKRGHLAMGDARIMRDVDWPSMTVSWRRLDAQGALLEARQDETVNDMDYLRRIPAVDADPDSLPFERRMLTRWFERRFCAR